MLDETAIIVAIITGAFGLGVAVGKAYFDRKQSKQALRDTQSQRALYLFGKIEGLLKNSEKGIINNLRDISEEINKMQSDPSFLAGLVGYLEIQLESVESAKANLEELKLEREELQIVLNQYKQYFYSLLEQFEDIRQQKIKAGEEAPIIPDWVYDLADRNNHP